MALPFAKPRADAADVFIDAKGRVRVLAGDVRQVAYPGQNRPLTFAEAMERSAATPAGKLNIIPRYQVTQGQKGKLTSSLYTDLEDWRGVRRAVQSLVAGR
jgi:hypothetical protein